MAVEIRTSGVKPLRNTFAFLERRFGDKPATRYQEIAFDTQPEINFHYKPLWDPDGEVYDKRRTALVMSDWYALKDPRQYYYGSYTTTRAKQQDAIDRQFGFVEKRELLATLPEEATQAIVFALVALRHYEWGANMNNCFIAAYGWGTTITQAAIMATTDRLGLAQHLSRIGLLTDGKTGRSLDAAKQHWLQAPAWQGIRQAVETLFVTRDWFELMVAQNLVADGLIYPLFYQHFDQHFCQQHGSALASLTDYSSNWHKESSRWVDAVLKAATSESEANQTLINQWVAHWHGIFATALQPLITELLGDAAGTAMDDASQQLNQRLKKAGLQTL